MDACARARDLSVSTATGAGAAARSSRAGHSSLGRALSTASCRRCCRGRCACAGGYPLARRAVRQRRLAAFPVVRHFLPRVLDRTAQRPIDRRRRSRRAARARCDPRRRSVFDNRCPGRTGGIQRDCDKRLQHRNDGRDAGARGTCSHPTPWPASRPTSAPSPARTPTTRPAPPSPTTTRPTTSATPRRSTSSSSSTARTPTPRPGRTWPRAAR